MTNKENILNRKIENFSSYQEGLLLSFSNSDNYLLKINNYFIAVKKSVNLIHRVIEDFEIEHIDGKGIYLFLYLSKNKCKNCNTCSSQKEYSFAKNSVVKFRILNVDKN